MVAWLKNKVKEFVPKLAVLRRIPVAAGIASGLLVLVAGYVIMSSSAAKLVYSVEVEQLTQATNTGRVFNDSTASEGKALALDTYEVASGTVTTTGLATDLILRAKGAHCQGYPTAKVKVNGSDVLVATVSSGSWAEYKALVELPAGTHTIEASFSNPYVKTSGKGKGLKTQCTRSVDLDVVRLEDSTPPPPPADSEQPTVSITSPANGATISGVVPVSANATDNAGVTKVEFYIDNQLRSTTLASPFAFSWDTATATNASHTIMAKAYDAAGNSASSTATVNVNNSSATNEVMIYAAPGGLQNAYQQAIAANKQNKPSRIVLQPTVYRESLIMGAFCCSTSQPIVIDGQGATISGADVYSNWTNNGDGTYKTTWTHNLGNAADPWPTLSYDRVLLNREALFVGQTPYVVVDSLSKLVPGTFVVDEGSDTLTVRPRTEHTPFATAEITVRPKTLHINGANNVTVKNVTIERGAGAVQESMSGSNNSSNITWENVTFRQAAASTGGGCCGKNITYRNVWDLETGIASLGVYKAENVTLENVEIVRNNWRGNFSGFNGWSVGTKIMHSKNVNVVNWNAHHNYTHGFWLDYDNRNVTINGLVSAGNLGRGVYFELSPGPISMENAVVCNNGNGGIAYARSDYTTVRNSKLFMNAGWQLYYTGQPAPVLMPDGVTYASGTNLTFENNVVKGDDWKVKDSLEKGWLFSGNMNDSVLGTGNKYANNTWYHTQRANAFKVTGVWNEWAEYSAFAAKVGETGGQYKDPGTLTCPANRPPATVTYDNGW